MQLVAPSPGQVGSAVLCYRVAGRNHDICCMTSKKVSYVFYIIEV